MLEGTTERTTRRRDEAWACFRRWQRTREAELDETAPLGHSLARCLADLWRGTETYKKLEDVRAAVSWVGRTCGLLGVADDPYVKAVFEAAQRARPRKQRARKIWDAAIIRKHFENGKSDEELQETDLMVKTATLLMLASRVHLTELLRLDKTTIEESDDGMTATVLTLKPKARVRTLFIPRGPSEKCCPAGALRTYIRRFRSAMEKGQADKRVFTATEGQLRRGIQQVMVRAGVPPLFTPYSLVHAGTSSRLSNEHWTREAECRHGGWSYRTGTLEAHYALQAYPQAGRLSFGE